MKGLHLFDNFFSGDIAPEIGDLKYLGESFVLKGTLCMCVCVIPKGVFLTFFVASCVSFQSRPSPRVQCSSECRITSFRE